MSVERRIRPATPWFNAVLLRGYLALQTMAANLDHAAMVELFARLTT